MTGPVDDWTAEYAPGGPNHEWFEQYLSDIEETVSVPHDLSPKVPANRADFGISARVILDGQRVLTVVPTSPKVSLAEINVMDTAGSVQTVSVDRLTLLSAMPDAPPVDDLHQDQGCGYRWNDMIGFLNPGPSRRHRCAKEVHTLSSDHECGCGDTRTNVDPLLDLDPHAHQTCGFRWRDEFNTTGGSEHQCAMPVHPKLTDWHVCRCDATRPGVVVLRAQLGEEQA